MIIALVIIRSLLLGYEVPTFLADENPVAANPSLFTRVSKCGAIKIKNVEVFYHFSLPDVHILLPSHITFLVIDLSGLVVLRLVAQLC